MSPLGFIGNLFQQAKCHKIGLENFPDFVLGHRNDIRKIACLQQLTGESMQLPAESLILTGNLHQLH